MNSKQWIFLSGMGFQLAGMLVVGYYIGGFCDQKMGTNGVFLAIFLLGSLGSWLIQLLIILKRIDKEEEEKKKEQE